MEKSGVFISHWDPEKGVALALQVFLKGVFGEAVRVFVSSDRRSIPGGKNWFESTMNGLKSAKVVLVVVSEHSLDARWINLEAGVGLGADSRVIPLVIRNCPKSAVGFPLAALQVRDLHVNADVVELLNEISEELKLPQPALDPGSFIEEVMRMEAAIAVSIVVMKPKLANISDRESHLMFTLENTGTKDADIRMVEAAVPEEYLFGGPQFVACPDVLAVSRQDLGGHRYVRLQFKAKGQGVQYSGGMTESLPLLSPGMPVYDLPSPFRFVMKRVVRREDGRLPVYYKVYVGGISPVERSKTYTDIYAESD
jgi:hypothetical protein